MPKRDLATAFGRCCRFFDHRPAIAYGAALGCVALALALRAALMLVEPGIVPFALLYPAFMTAALVGGFGPGMAALAIGLLSAWLPLPSPWSLAPGSPSAVSNLALLAVTGGALIVLAAMLREALTRLLASQERLRLAIRSTGLGTWDFDGMTGSRRWSREFRAISGIDAATPADTELFTTLIHPDDRDWVNQRYRAAYDPAGDGWYHAEFRIRRADSGAERWVRATGRMFFDAKGKLLRAAGTILDITDQRGSDAALRESEERYRTLVETAPEAVHVHRDGVIVLANQQAAKLFGGERPSDIIGRSAMSLVDETSRELARSRTAQLRAAGARNQPVEMTMRRLDGGTVVVEATSAAVLLDGQLVVQAVLRDITQRRQGEAALRESEARFRLAAAAVQGIVYDVDLLTGASWRSDGLKRVLDIAPETVPNRESWWIELIHPEDAINVAHHRALLDDPDVSHLDLEYRIRHADGHWLNLHDRSFIVRDQTGRAVRLIGVATDISERKAAEARQVLLMREVDHRARNALSVVQSLVRLTRAANQHDFARAVEGRVAALARAHTLLSDNQWRSADLRTIIEAELADFRGGASIFVSGPVVSLHPGAVQPLSLVIHELITNAAKHGGLSTPDGRLDITWQCDAANGVQLRWEESGGPPIPLPPETSGFGSILIQTTVRGQLGGKLDVAWLPQGLRCEFSIAPRHLG